MQFVRLPHEKQQKTSQYNVAQVSKQIHWKYLVFSIILKYFAVCGKVYKDKLAFLYYFTVLPLILGNFLRKSFVIVNRVWVRHFQCIDNLSTGEYYLFKVDFFYLILDCQHVKKEKNSGWIYLGLKIWILQPNIFLFVPCFKTIIVFNKSVWNGNFRFIMNDRAK